jgi:hypothetical protein
MARHQHSVRFHIVHFYPIAHLLFHHTTHLPGGEFRNLTYFAELMNATGKPILVEDCHWGGDGPGDWGDGGHLNAGPNQVPQEKWYGIPNPYPNPYPNPDLIVKTVINQVPQAMASCFVLCEGYL